MLGFTHNWNQIMTLSRSSSSDLSDDEWNELVALKNAINANPASVHPEKMELFKAMLVKTLEGKSD